jgi:hypothetical protein
VIGDVVLHQSGSRLETGKVNHYVTDGEIAFANLMDIEQERPVPSPPSLG